jgi:hypothetical protein
METKRRFTEYGPEKKTQRGDSNLKKNSTIKNLVSVTGVLMVISVCAWHDPCANYDLELESQSIKIWFGNRLLFKIFVQVYVNLHVTVNWSGADPEVLLTDALNLNLALVGGSGGILPR